MLDVTWPIKAIAVSASKSFGTCGTQIELKPACSADSAAARSLATLSPYWPFSGPTMRPIRTWCSFPRAASQRDPNEVAPLWQ